MVLPQPSEIASARIVIVDDNPANVELLKRVLEPAGYRNIVSTTDPRQVPRLCAAATPDLLLLDLRMPHMDGVEVIEALRAELPGFASLPVVVLTSDHSREAMQRALSCGARDFLTKPFSASEVRLRVANLIENRLLYLAVERHNRTLEDVVRERTAELEEARIEILQRLAIAAEYHDPETGEHTRRVGEDSARIAIDLGLPAAEVELIRRAAPLHDVGKIGIQDAILLKPGPLTCEEQEKCKLHTIIGERILSGSSIPLLNLAAEIALSHHESWDGSGYPCGLSREEICLPARIVSVADVFDSLTHERPYKEAWSDHRALDVIREQRGTKFDPRVVDAFLRAMMASAA